MERKKTIRITGGAVTEGTIVSLDDRPPGRDIMVAMSIDRENMTSARELHLGEASIWQGGDRTYVPITPVKKPGEHSGKHGRIIHLVCQGKNMMQISALLQRSPHEIFRHMAEIIKEIYSPGEGTGEQGPRQESRGRTASPKTTKKPGGKKGETKGKKKKTGKITPVEHFTDPHDHTYYHPYGRHGYNIYFPITREIQEFVKGSERGWNEIVEHLGKTYRYSPSSISVTLLYMKQKNMIAKGKGGKYIAAGEDPASRGGRTGTGLTPDETRVLSVLKNTISMPTGQIQKKLASRYIFFPAGRIRANLRSLDGKGEVTSTMDKGQLLWRIRKNRKK